MDKTKRKKILVVDDSKVVQMTQRIILEKAGIYDLVFANDGAEAIEQAVHEQPDLILLDVVMPRLNGIEALDELRNRDDTREIPVIMVTTRSEKENIQSAYETGCNDYVTKPVDTLELLDKINRILGEA